MTSLLDFLHTIISIEIALDHESVFESEVKKFLPSSSCYTVGSTETCKQLITKTEMLQLSAECVKELLHCIQRLFSSKQSACSLVISSWLFLLLKASEWNLYLHSEVDYNLLLHMVLDSDIFLQLLTELLLVIMWMTETGIVYQLSFEHTILPAYEVVSLSSWNPAHLLIIFHKPSWSTAEINGNYFLPSSERRIQSCVSSYILFLKYFIYLECHACRSCLLLHQHMVKF